ncbi:unnamed protein product [Staurois parvus]|uniref:Uncharacterized protein n=1 Tax=Staurois parvus TaxID=386267 RepID=A0ABN9BT77_9NEOB|nr:unnamed protein product [Staurois parvus]
MEPLCPRPHPKKPMNMCVQPIVLGCAPQSSNTHAYLIDLPACRFRVKEKCLLLFRGGLTTHGAPGQYGIMGQYCVLAQTQKSL